MNKPPDNHIGERGSNPAPVDPSLIADIPRILEIALRPGESEVEPDVASAIGRIVEKSRAHPVAIEAVAAELILATILSYFRQPETAANAWRAIADRVATTLMDDPASHQRLATLWHQLNEDRQ